MANILKGVDRIITADNATILDIAETKAKLDAMPKTGKAMTAYSPPYNVMKWGRYNGRNPTITDASGYYSCGNWFGENTSVSLYEPLDGSTFNGAAYYPDFLHMKFVYENTSNFYQNNNPNAGPPDMTMNIYSKWDTEVGNTNQVFTNTMMSITCHGTSSYYGWNGKMSGNESHTGTSTAGWKGFDGNSEYTMTMDPYMRWAYNGMMQIAVDTQNGQINVTGPESVTFNFDKLRVKSFNAYGGYNGGGMTFRYSNLEWGTDGTEPDDLQTPMADQLTYMGF